ncbi:MAG: polysaccharide pyruvyl transferase family protein [Prosthecobacter sp.]|uniref:polysaccharide pyruvyl transferase family protein n=1 Tax=Prosthecobacter sp. TaxID=1965333 RepID=UPI0025EC04F4|nr:polysaccharide pyruvyl transferase family protein [Prosthecobacter sp.]MCF7785454.1 polysaccharide pyruvyl transferase family protein [Prosthecobacter sp.]
MKIAFVGASGYGNIGDDTYPLVFAEQLPAHELEFYNSDLPRSLPDNLDMIVIGGGGVVHNSGAEPEESESHHFRCMRFYMDAAIERGIPWGFLSCGFQFQAQREAAYARSHKPWVPYLQRASFITLRSRECVRIACEISGRTDAQFFPDAAYLFHPAGEREQDQPDGVTIVPAGQVNLHDVLTNHYLRQFAASGIPVTWLSMGAKVDDGRMLEEAAQRFPESRIITADPVTAFRCIAASRLVMTGRYHGMVFSRISRVPFITPINVPYKMRHEDYDAPVASAAGHFEVLRRFIGG